jgi:hypothetical protein
VFGAFEKAIRPARRFASVPITSSIKRGGDPFMPVYCVKDLQRAMAGAFLASLANGAAARSSSCS